MNDASIRLEALKLAIQLNFAVGVACPGCAATLAQQLTDYVTTGDVTAVKHFDQPDTEQAVPALNVIPFDPNSKPN